MMSRDIDKFSLISRDHILSLRYIYGAHAIQDLKIYTAAYEIHGLLWAPRVVHGLFHFN